MIWQEITGPISDTDPLVQGNKKKKKGSLMKIRCSAKTKHNLYVLHTLRVSPGKTENKALSKLLIKAIYFHDILWLCVARVY